MRTLIPSLVLDCGGALIVCVSLLAVLGATELLWRRTRLSARSTRKISHVGSGLVVLALPFLVCSALTVAVLAVGFLGLLVVGRRHLQSVHGVRRRTSGAYVYPVVVWAVFWLSEGDPVLYCPAIAVMAISDTAAAVVGTRYGLRGFRVLGCTRTWLGCFAFFSSACMVLSLWALLVQPVPLVWLLPLVVVTAAVVTAAEAVSVLGLDNLFVPLVCFAVLRLALEVELPALALLVPP